MPNVATLSNGLSRHRENLIFFCVLGLAWDPATRVGGRRNTYKKFPLPSSVTKHNLVALSQTVCANASFTPKCVYMAQPLKFTRGFGSDTVWSSHNATAAAASKEPDRVDANTQVDVGNHRVSGRPHPQGVLIIVRVYTVCWSGTEVRPELHHCSSSHRWPDSTPWANSSLIHPGRPVGSPVILCLLYLLPGAQINGPIK